MFEKNGEELITRFAFGWRMLRSFGATLAVVGPMAWDDGLLNATMILTGMGPVEPHLETRAGKLFATFYALYSGLAFLSMVAIIMAPVLHRFLHHFHLEDESDI
jgi:hypothetical protein